MRGGLGWLLAVVADLGDDSADLVRTRGETEARLERPPLGDGDGSSWEAAVVEDVHDGAGGLTVTANKRERLKYSCAAES